MAFNVMKCGCTSPSPKKSDPKAITASEYQDKRYGKGKRVHTPFIKNNGGWRCTVCGAERQ